MESCKPWQHSLSAWEQNGLEERREKYEKIPYYKNHRVVRIKKIRQQMIALKSQYKEAGASECIGLAQLMSIL